MFNIKKFNSKKFSLASRKKQGFTTVEILVAVGLVAILMVVAVPRLLGTRQSVGDSAAKQQLNTVGVAVNNWFVERDTFTGMALDKITARVPEVDIVAGDKATGKREGGRALMVSLKFPVAGTTAGSAADVVVLAASNGDNNCWAAKYSKAGVEYAYAAMPTDVATCSADAMSSKTFVKFEFPPATN
jgi:type II secretory pathway pseudopilin PulG